MRDGRAPEVSVLFDFFLSYPRVDVAWVSELRDALSGLEATVWIDRSGMPAFAQDWLDEIRRAITSADIFVLVLSQEYLNSPHCIAELQGALAAGKRLAIVEHRPIERDERSQLPERVRRAAWVSSARPLDTARTLVSFARTDSQLAREHTRILGQALWWLDQGEPAGLLLRGKALHTAMAWAARASRAEGLSLTKAQIDFLRRSREAHEARQDVLFKVVLVATIALAAWLIQRSDSWQAWRAYVDGSELVKSARDSDAVEWADALIHAGRTKEAMALSNWSTTGRAWSSRACGIASRFLLAGDARSAVSLVHRFTTDRLFAHTDIWELEGRFYTFQIPATSHDAVRPHPGWEQQGEPRLPPREYEDRAENVDSADALTIDRRVSDYVRAAFGYAALHQMGLAEEMLLRANQLAEADENSVLRLQVLDRVSEAAKSLGLATAEADGAAAMYWALRGPYPIFANQIWRELAGRAKSDPEYSRTLTFAVDKARGLPAISRALAMLTFADALRESDLPAAATAIDAALAARTEVQNPWLRAYFTARAADVLGYSDRGRAADLLRAERRDCVTAPAAASPLSRSLCLFVLGSALARTGAPDAEGYLLVADSVAKERLAGSLRSTALALGARMSATADGGDAGLDCLYELLEGVRKVQEIHPGSRVRILAAEAALERQAAKGLKRPTPAYLIPEFLRGVTDSELRHDFIGRWSDRLAAQAGVWGSLTAATAAADLALRDASGATELLDNCDFEDIPPPDRSLARSRAAVALARLHRIREARRMAQTAGPEDRLAALAAILKEYSSSRVGRVLARLWPS